MSEMHDDMMADMMVDQYKWKIMSKATQIKKLQDQGVSLENIAAKFYPEFTVEEGKRRILQILKLAHDFDMEDELYCQGF